MIPVVTAKADVALTFASGGIRILAAIDRTTQALGVNLELTAGSNDHQPPSRHVTGEAYDLSVRGFDLPTILRIKRTLESLLGIRFTVSYEIPLAVNDPAVMAVATVNHNATGPHLHTQVASNVPRYPPPDETGALRA